MKYIASVSFGKDSLAMLLLLLEKHKPLDEVIFYDTGMEFAAIYDIRDAILPLLKNRGILYTELHPAYDFEYQMMARPVQGRKGGTHCGYSWCGGRCRWGTTDKLRALEYRCVGACEYVGIASDETERLKKERKGHKVFPLAEWGKTEANCLLYCYDRGFEWREHGANTPDGTIRLYDILDRVSCWCCANKNLRELRNIYRYLPDYWERLTRLDLVPPEAVMALGRVLTYGAEKYAPNSWRGVEPERYVAALLRHLMAYQMGETHDPESEMPHMWHVLTNAAFLVALT